MLTFLLRCSRASPGPRAAIAEPDWSLRAHTLPEDRTLPVAVGRPPLGLWATELYLANASNRRYLQCGFGGNRAGARLCITSFAIKARK